MVLADSDITNYCCSCLGDNVGRDIHCGKIFLCSFGGALFEIVTDSALNSQTLRSAVLLIKMLRCMLHQTTHLAKTGNPATDRRPIQ